jgi:hypothetical protein
MSKFLLEIHLVPELQRWEEMYVLWLGKGLKQLEVSLYLLETRPPLLHQEGILRSAVE